MAKKRKYTIEELKLAASLSYSMYELLRRLGMCPTGGGYVTPKKLIKEHNIDISHWRGRGWSKGKKFPTKKSLINDYLENKKPIGSHSLKLKLFEAGLLEKKCTWCGIGPEYNGKLLSLELDHIDGNKDNNNLNNLRILCPNCHSQTDTHRKKNIKYKRNKNFS